MITINIKDGIGSIPKGSHCNYAYDPPGGTVIKYVTEEGDEYLVVASESHASIPQSPCHGCVFNASLGHPLSKIFHNICDIHGIRVLCHGRIYKPLDTIMEEL